MRYTNETARQIALCGADKMFRQGYAYAQDGDNGRAFLVTKPNGDRYHVIYVENENDPDEYLVICTCPFSGDGFENCTCKHGEFVRTNEQANKAIETRAAVSDALRRVWSDHQSPAWGDARAASHYAHAADYFEAFAA